MGRHLSETLDAISEEDGDRIAACVLALVLAVKQRMEHAPAQPELVSAYCPPELRWDYRGGSNNSSKCQRNVRVATHNQVKVS